MGRAGDARGIFWQTHERDEEGTRMSIKEAALGRSVGWVRALQVGGLMVLGVLIPSLGMPQPITGPLVNALLILSVGTVGVGPAIIVGMMTPLSAVLHGVLPLPLMVMIPFNPSEGIQIGRDTGSPVDEEISAMGFQGLIRSVRVSRQAFPPTEIGALGS